MNNLTKYFISTIILIFVLFSTLVGTLFASSQTDYEQIKEVAMLTKLPGVSLSTSYIENRVIYHDDFSNRFYLDMPDYNYMNFTYVK